MIAVDTETALFYGFISLMILVIATLIVLLIHSGFFAEIDVKTCKPCIGEVKIAYKSAIGPYKDSGALFTEVHSLLPQYRTIGVYYDDPRKKEASRLRYIVGLILSENGEPSKKEEETILSERGYKFATFPAINHAVQTSFPFNSTLSIIVAIFRVYPILDEYVDSRSLCAHPFIEVYDNENLKIFFWAPLEKQDDFYVPEVKDMDGNNTQDDDIEESDSQSNESADESAYHRSGNTGSFDSDNAGDRSLSASSATEGSLLSDAQKLLQSCQSKTPAKDSDSVLSPCPKKPGPGDESDHTSSSFEEIDESDAPELPAERKSSASPSTS